MLKWLWKMFVRYVIGYYVPPGTVEPPRPPASKWDAAEGKIVVMQLSKRLNDDEPVQFESYLLEVYVHGLSLDRRLAYCVAKQNSQGLSLTQNWFAEDEYDRYVRGILGPIPEERRIDMSEVLSQTQYVAPSRARTNRRQRAQPAAQPQPRRPATPAPAGPNLREIDLPPDQPTEPTP